MNQRTKTGLEILETAILAGIFGDAFLRATPWGLNVFLCIGALSAAMLALVLRRRRDLWNARNLSLHGALIFFAAMFVWRDSAELKMFNALAIFIILAVLTLPALKIKTSAAGVIHYIFAGAWSAISAAFSPFALLLNDIEWKTIPQTGWTKNLIAVLRGVAIAAPILGVFGALFMAADAVFQGIVENTLRIDPAVLLSHVFLTGMIAWAAAGYLRGSLFGVFSGSESVEIKPPDEIKAQIGSVTEIKSDELQADAAQTETEEIKKEKTWDWRNFDNSFLPKSLTLGAIEIGIILGLMNALFLSFVIVQIPYLFGGMNLVQNTPDFKLAEYARRGFGELVTVSALVLPLLLLVHWLLRKDGLRPEKIYRALAGTQIVLLFVIMISATQRLLLYTGNLGYGLTSTRLYPMAFMVWLALVFVWFGITVLRGAREQFAWGALWLGFFVLGTLHFFNPDEFIVKTNVRLMREGRAFDSGYVTNLSDDAVPALLDVLPAMKFEQQCAIRWKLSNRLNQAQNENDFRTWNVSRWTARREMSQYAESFDTAGCPPPAPQNYDDF